MATHQQPKSCGVLIVCGDPIDSFLLMKHADRWDLPKGHVDPGETEVQCALREMEEETGIPATSVVLDPDFRFTQQYLVQGSRYGAGKSDMILKTLVIFLARIAEACPISVTEHADSRWFPWQRGLRLQPRTIDPLLTYFEGYLEKKH